MKRMRRSLLRRPGWVPGTPVFVGEQRAPGVKITVFRYDKEKCEERRVESLADCRELIAGNGVVWINVDGLHDIKMIEELGSLFSIHPLALEDIADTTQRPKTEDYGDYLYIVLKMFSQEAPETDILSEQVSLVLAENLLISFQEREGDVFQEVRERLRQGKGRIRKKKSDYLAYCLIDAIVDQYFAILENLEDRLDPLEDRLIENPNPRDLQLIQHLKREIVTLRHSLWPVRELVLKLDRDESSLIEPDTRPFLRDVYDHVIMGIEMLESSQDLIAGMKDTYMSSISNRMNNIMRVLTIIATIFIPLTFVAGIYGMNFQFMPELAWRYGYPAVWTLMAGVFVGMIIYFKRKHWL
jgi:magnesium transporter